MEVKINVSKVNPLCSLATVLFVLTCMACKTSLSDNAAEILTAKEFITIAEQEQVALLDVRTPKEYESGSFDNAVNIDFYADDFADQVAQKFDKNAPLYLFCHSGKRSAKAAKILKTEGFKKVFDLEGGYQEVLKLNTKE